MSYRQRRAQFDQPAKVDDGIIHVTFLQQYLGKHVLSVSTLRIEPNRPLKSGPSRGQVSALGRSNAGLIGFGGCAVRGRLCRRPSDATDNAEDDQSGTKI